MAQIKNIDIPQPCHQSWQQMTPNDNGRHCRQCAKTVTDFTAMTNNEIITYLGTNHNVCGRFGQQQLGSINRQLLIENMPVTNKLKGWAMVVGLLSSVTFFNACAQIPVPVVQTVVDIKRAVCDQPTIGKIMTFREVKGRVTNDQSQALTGAMIVVPSTDYKTTTDINGNFVLQVPYSVKQFTVNMIGYQQKIVTIDEKEDLINNNIKLNEDINIKLNQVFMGEVTVTNPPLVKRIYYRLIKKPVNKLFK